MIRTRMDNMFCVIALLVIAGCKNIDKSSVNVTEGTNAFLARIYVKGFNTANPDSMALAVTRVFTERFLKNNGGPEVYGIDRLELFRTYGPLKFDFNDTTTNPNITWYKGMISGCWVGYQFHVDSSQKAERVTTWRARPVPYPQSELTESAVADSLNHYLDRMAAAGFFSGSITLSHNRKMLLNKSWGTNKWEVPQPINNSTRFHIASVTKLFTVVLALQLVEEGRLSLDDVIGKYVPEYPEPYRSKVKVIHLLTHTSGIELDRDKKFFESLNSASNVEELLSAQLAAIKNSTPSSEPGEDYNYLNEGVDLVGVIIGRITGISYQKNVEEKILQPAGMTDTRVNMPESEGNYAIGKTSVGVDLGNSDPGLLKDAMQILPRNLKPSSGIWSNAQELHLFMTALLNYQLLNKELTDSMMSINRITYENPKYGIKSWVGLGIQGEDLWETRTLGHGGVVPGFSAVIEFLPDTNWLLTVTSNSGEASGFVVFQRFLELTANLK